MKLYELDDFVNDFSLKLPLELMNDFDVIRNYIEKQELALNKACEQLEYFDKEMASHEQTYEPWSEEQWKEWCKEDAE